MKVLVAGGSGLIGSALLPALRADGHQVLTLVRRPAARPDEVTWDPGAQRLDPDALVGVQAAINLAGAGIGTRRWSPAYKRLLLDSRVRSTDLLARTLARLRPSPTVLLSASAVGYYGDTGGRPVTEQEPPGAGFLAGVCVAWEAATAPAEAAGLRVCHLRTGIVVSRDGGAFARLVPLTKVGLGGPIGSGRQYQSWISRTDEVGALRFLLNHPLAGPVNLTGPEPLPQAEIARILGRALHRPALLRTPAVALRAALGEFAAEGVLIGQRALPAALQAAGFRFTHPTFAAAVHGELLAEPR